MASICIPGVGTVVGGAILGAGLDAAIQYGDNGKVDVKQVRDWNSTCQRIKEP